MIFSRDSLVLFFNFPSCCLFGKNPIVIENPNSFQHYHAGTLTSSSVGIIFTILPKSFDAHRIRHAAIHQFGPHSLPCTARAFSAPNQNLALPVHSSSYQITIFQKKIRYVHRSCAFPWHLHVLAAPSTSLALILFGLCTPLRSMLRLLIFLVKKITFLLASASTLQNLSIPALGSES